MINKLVIVVCLGALVKNVVSIDPSREGEGYPLGYLTDCPGVTKEAQIKNGSLRHLQFVHLQKGYFLTAKSTEYNYFQMKQLAPNLNFKKKTILFVTGYRVTFSPFSPAMGEMYTKKGYNVLLLEYLKFNDVAYPVAARLLRPVGRRVAEMLVELTTFGLDPKKLDLLGISHGGHGAGFTGKHFRKITGKNISRITALDPSGPCFRRLGPENRIDASDADMVDIIHTNIDAYGMAAAIGHVTFYVNGGENQSSDWPELGCSSYCSHIKAFLLWLASLAYPDSFIAFKCDSIQDVRDRTCFNRPLVTNVMGLKTDFNVQGIFYLATTDTYPYHMGEKGLDDDYIREKSFVSRWNREDVLIV